MTFTVQREVMEPSCIATDFNHQLFCYRNGRLSPDASLIYRQTMTCIAGLRCDGLTAPGVIEGAMDGDAFAQDSKTQRAATLQKGAVVGLDKLPAHQRDGARRAVEKRGAWLLFLPPYAPDCNPIELALSKFKAHMKRLKPRPIDDLWQAAGNVCGRFNHAHCRNLFVADGYASE